MRLIFLNPTFLNLDAFFGSNIFGFFKSENIKPTFLILCFGQLRYNTKKTRSVKMYQATFETKHAKTIECKISIGRKKYYLAFTQSKITDRTAKNNSQK